MLSLSVPAQGCCCLVVQRRILQVSACEYEPVCALCSSSPGLQAPLGTDLAQPMLWMEGLRAYHGARLQTGHTGAEASNVPLLLLTCCATLGKSINLSGPCFCMNKLLTTDPLPGITQKPLVNTLTRVTPRSVSQGEQTPSCL